MTDRAYIVSRTLETKIAMAENNGNNALIVTIDMLKEILSLLKEQDELLHKKQKDVDRLCNEISEWKQKYHDKLLKEQEPVEPFEEGINDFNCGKCGAGLSVDNDWKYCPHCGKKVKWE